MEYSVCQFTLCCYPRQYLTFPVETVMIIKVTRNPACGILRERVTFTLQLTSIKLKDTKFKNINYSCIDFF